MKKISLVLALVFSVLVTTAQTWTKVNGRWEYQYMRFDNTVGTFTPPLDTLPGAPAGSLAVKNDIPYYKLSSGTWIPVTGAAANLATTNLTATGNYTHNWNNKQLIIDSVNQYYMFARAKRFGLWERINISAVPSGDAFSIQHAMRKADNSADSLTAVYQTDAGHIHLAASSAVGRNAVLDLNNAPAGGQSSVVVLADTIRLQAIPKTTADTVLATGPYDPITKSNPVYKIKLNTNGQNIANTGLEATGDYDQNWKNYQLRIDSMKRMALISRGNFLGSQSRTTLNFEPSFGFPMLLNNAQRDVANTIDSVSTSLQFLADGAVLSTNNAVKTSAVISVRSGLGQSDKPYISLSADSILAKLKPQGSGDTILVTGLYNPSTGLNPVYKAPLSGLVGAQNGLTKNGINIELGGALTKMDTININNTAHGLKFIGNNTFASNVPMVDIQDTLGTSGGVALRASSRGNGSAINGYTYGSGNGTAISGWTYANDGFTYGAGTGIFGATGTGLGLYGFAQSTGIGTYSQSGSGLAYYGNSSLACFNFETTNATYPVSGVHTIGTFGKLNQGQFFGAPGAGFGSSIDYSLTADNGTSNGATRVGLKFITKWATATDASRSAAWEMQLVNGATLGRRLRMEPDGVLTLDRYASSVSGTAAFGLGVDNTGKLVTTTASGVSASNGLTAVGTDIQLGGTITGTTTINSTGSSSNRIVVNGTSSTAWAPFYSLDNGTGAALMGLQNNSGGKAFIAQNFASGGVSLSSISSAGVAIAAFDGGNGVALSGQSTTGLPLTLVSDLNTGNTTNTLIQLQRNNGTAATGASIGMGGDILVKLEDGSGSGGTLDAGRISTYWTGVTSGQEKSAIDFATRNNGFFSNKFSIKDTGQLQAYRYGAGNFETIDTSYPAAVFGPDGKVYARRGDAGSGGGSTPTWQQTLAATGGHTLTTDHSVVQDGHTWNWHATTDGLGILKQHIGYGDGFYDIASKSSDGSSDSTGIHISGEEAFSRLYADRGNGEFGFFEAGQNIRSFYHTATGETTMNQDGAQVQFISNSLAHPAIHEIITYADSIIIRGDTNQIARTRLRLYLQGLPKSTTGADSFLVVDANNKVAKYAKVKFVQTATVSVIANDNETTLVGSGTGSLTIPANTMTAGKSYRLTVRGTYGTDASNPAQQNWRVYLGGTIILASGNAGLGTNKTDKIFVTQVDITCRTTGSSGTVMAVGMFNTEDGPGAKGFPPTTTTVNTTGGLTLDFTTDLTDGSAGNNMKVYSLIFEEI